MENAVSTSSSSYSVSESAASSTSGISNTDERKVSTNIEIKAVCKKKNRCIRTNEADISDDVLYRMQIFRRKQKIGTVDVWWLYDDGGLTLLLPYILLQRSKFAESELRLFTVHWTDSRNKFVNIEEETKKIKDLMSKFRIKCKLITVVNIEISEPPLEDFVQFTNILGDGEPMNPILTAKTYKYIKLRKKIEEYSLKSNMIVLTVPVIRKETMSASLVMAWLEYLSRGENMPPFLFVRGNQRPVLTLYS